jgi:hypothetical protein
MTSKPLGEHRPAQDHGISADFMNEVTRRIEEREALNPSPPPPPQVPWPDKPYELIAAEKELMRWEFCGLLQSLTCQTGPACTRAFCRRHKRCREMDVMDAEIAKARARLAALQAKWPAPDPAQILPAPAATKKKGRTEARP